MLVFLKLQRLACYQIICNETAERSLIDFLIGLASIEVKRSLINSLNDDVVDVGGERKFVPLVLDL